MSVENLHEQLREPSDDAGHVPGEASLRELIAMIWQNVAWIGLVTGLALLVGAIYVALTPSRYVATTSILIDASPRPPLGADMATYPIVAADTGLVDSQARLLTSETVLKRVVIAEKLDSDPEFVGQRPGLFGMITRILLPSPPAHDASDKAGVALLALEKAVTVNRSEHTYVMDVEVAASQPEKAARLANAVASAYIADRSAAHDQLAQNDSAALTQHLQSLQSQLTQAETRYQAYREAHQIYDANGKKVNELDLSDSSTLLSKARAATSEAKARYDAVRTALKSGRSVDATSAAIKSPLIDKLRAQYADVTRQEATYATTLGDRNPALVETRNQLRAINGLIAQELRRIAANAASDYQVAVANQAEVARQLGALKKASDQTSGAAIELATLKNDVDAKRAVYEKFLRARDSITDESSSAQFARVITPAVPPTFATAPRKTLILGLSGLIGLFSGVSLVLFYEYFKASGTQAHNPARGRGFGSGRSGTGIAAQAQDQSPSLEKPVSIRRPAGKAKVGPPAATWSALPQDKDRFYAALLEDCDLEAAELIGSPSPLTLLVAGLGGGEAFDSRGEAAGIALAMAATRSRSRVLVLQADPEISDLFSQLDRAAGQLIQMGSTARPSFPLLGNPKIQVVPVVAHEEMLVRRMRRQLDLRIVPQIAGHFDVVILLGGLIGENAELPELAQNAARVVLEARAPQPDAAEISDALRQLDVSPEKFGGLWMLDASQNMAA
ncbi:MAG: GumC family protein [Hyphomicrobiales bacterium]|nr:GumC family protein [Hyphomicrobiales bacterium]MDE2115734.1 GumC family protein [Hyphomicrobiales bacterium]